jgi:hypothetical protein
MHIDYWWENLLKNGKLEDCEGDGRIVKIDLVRCKDERSMELAQDCVQ